MKKMDYIPHILIGAFVVYSTFRVMKYVGFIITDPAPPLPPHN